MSRPWLSVEEDETGTARVVVKEEHLRDFPKFMNDIIANRIGLDKGVFKINIVNRHGGTDLNTILNYIRAYFKTLRPQSKVTSSGKAKTVRCYPEVQMQTFKCSRAKDEQLYGYLNSLRTSAEVKKDREDFLKNVESPETFLNESTCCLQMLSRSVDDLVDYYWQEISASAAESRSIPYGGGIPIEGENITYSTNFTLSKLGTILELCPISYPGIQQPFLYVGVELATFAWHIEDSALFSINVLHHGAPCLWNFVPPSFYKKFVNHIQFFPLDLAQTSCINALGHKHILAGKDFLCKYGIPVHTVVQKENDILVIYPFCSHSGFKCGRNLQVAVNFADPWWVEPAILAPTCVCFVTQIHMDLKEFIAVARHHLLADYLNNDFPKLYKELEKNEFICTLGILPPAPSDEKSNRESMLVASPGTAAKELAAAEPPAEEPPAEEPPAEEPPAKKTATEEADEEPQFSGARCTIFCPLRPQCKKFFEGGRCKLPRMKAHIMKEHGGEQNLIDKLSHMYPPKNIMKKKGLDCSFCGHFVSGTSYHMNRHIERVHLK